MTFMNVTGIRWQDEQAKLDAMCDEWNALNVSIDGETDEDVQDAKLIRMKELDRAIDKQKAKLYRVARKAGVVLPGSRWARR